MTSAKIRRLLLLLALWWALPSLLLGASAPALADRGDTTTARPGQRVTFGVYAHIRSTEMLKKMAPLREYLESATAALGRPLEVEMRIFPTYGEAIDALAEGQVDLARFGPVSYVVAKEKNPAIRLLAMESNGGSKRFQGVISVPESSPVRSLEELRGRVLAFGAPKSTTGRYLAQAALVKAGIRARDLAGHSYLGRHDKVAFAVAAGHYDAGATNENTFNKYAADKGLRRLVSFPCVTKPWVARAGLAPELFETLRTALLELKEPRVLELIQRTGMLPAEDADYDMIREGMTLAREFDTLELRFAAYAAEQPSSVFAMLQPVLTELERRLEAESGLVAHFRLQIHPEYREAIEAIAGGEADLAYLGGASYVLAKERTPGLRLLAVDQNREGHRDAVIVVGESSPIHSLNELKGHTFAFGNRFSTSGRFIPQTALLDAGITAAELESYSYLGRHDRVALAVSLGNYDAGALRGEVFEQLAATKGLRAIERLPLPHRAWVVREGLDEELSRQLQAGLTSIHAREVLHKLGRTGFGPADDALFDPVRRAIARAREFE